MAIKNGETASADEVLNLVGTNFKNQAQLLYNSAYIGFNSKLNTATGVPSLKNVKYDIMTSDTATYFQNMEYDANNDYYKNIDNSIYGSYYIDVVADTSSFTTILNTEAKHIKSLPSGKNIYRVYATTGTDNEKKAKVIGALFFGSNGADARIDSFSGVTSLQCSENSDIGKKVIWGKFVVVDNGDFSSTGIFSNTTDNLAVEAWSNIGVNVLSGAGNSAIGYFSFPDGTLVNSAQVTGSSSPYSANSNEIGTDRTADKQDNPADTRLRAIDATAGVTEQIVNALFLTKGDITWTDVTDSRNFMVFEEIETSINSLVEFQTTSLPTITDGIATWNSSIDGDNTLTVSISADGTNYEAVTDATIHRFTNTGTNLYVKFEINRVDTSAIDKISEYAILYNVGAA